MTIRKSIVHGTKAVVLSINIVRNSSEQSKRKTNLALQNVAVYSIDGSTILEDLTNTYYLLGYKAFRSR